MPGARCAPLLKRPAAREEKPASLRGHLVAACIWALFKGVAYVGL
jgi:hypothetical protein